MFDSTPAVPDVSRILVLVPELSQITTAAHLFPVSTEPGVPWSTTWLVVDFALESPDVVIALMLVLKLLQSETRQELSCNAICEVVPSLPEVSLDESFAVILLKLVLSFVQIALNIHCFESLAGCLQSALRHYLMLAPDRYLVRHFHKVVNPYNCYSGFLLEHWMLLYQLHLVTRLH